MNHPDQIGCYLVFFLWPDVESVSTLESDCYPGKRLLPWKESVAMPQKRAYGAEINGYDRLVDIFQKLSKFVDHLLGSF